MSLSSSNVSTILKLLFEGILLLPVSLLGVVFNCFNIAFLWKKRKKLDLTEDFRNLLILLSVFDLLHLLSGIAIFVMPEISTWYSMNIYPHILSISFGILHIGVLGSILATVSIAIERYITVCHPTSTFSRKNLLITVPISIALLYNIPKFFEIVTCTEEELYATMLRSYFENDISRQPSKSAINDNLLMPHTLILHQNHTNSQNDSANTNDRESYEQPKNDAFHVQHMTHFLSTTNNEFVVNAMKLNTSPCDLYGHRMADFRRNGWYIIFYQFVSDLLLVKVIPWLTVIVLNIKVVIASRKFRKRRLQLLNKGEDSKGANERRQMQILLSIAIVFVFCHCFTIVPDIHEIICTVSEDNCQEIMYTYNVIEFGHLMLAVNSSINFIFYMFHIRLFREQIIMILCCHCRSHQERKNSNSSRKDNTVETFLMESNTILMVPILNRGAHSKQDRTRSC